MWYSAFSLRSPSSRAAWMRAAIWRRASPSSCASSALRASRPSAVIASPSLIAVIVAGRPPRRPARRPGAGARRSPAATTSPPRAELGEPRGVRALVVDEHDVEGPGVVGAVLRDDLEQRAHVVARERRLVADREDAVVARRAHAAGVGGATRSPATPAGAAAAAASGAPRARSRAKAAPPRVTASPRHSSTTSSSASSSSAARARGSRSSPKALSSRRLSPPRPAPKTMRPPERRSRTATWRATSHGRRRASGVTIAPRRRRSVASATAVSAIHGSATASPSKVMTWSQTKKPSQPLPSALGRHRGERADVGQLAEGRDVQAVAHGQAAAAATGHARRSVVERRALGGRAAGGVRGGDELRRVEAHAVVGAGQAADGLLHQRAAEVVDAPAQRLGRDVEAHLHPRGLQAGDRAPEREAEDGGVLEVLLARDLLDAVRAPEQRVEGDERQRHELGDPARALLQLAHDAHVLGQLPRLLDVAEHHRGGRAQPGRVARPR